MTDLSYRSLLIPVRRYEDEWWFRFWGCYKAMVRAWKIRRAEAEQRQFLSSVVPGRVQGAWAHAITNLEAIDHEMLPLPDEEEVRPIENDIDWLERRWKEEFGDKDDPAVQARIKATADWLGSGRRKRRKGG